VDGRYLSLGVRWDRRALSTNQGMLYGIDSTQGYLSVQLLRYWLFVRAVSDTPQSGSTPSSAILRRRSWTSCG
jgi:hypothetical protein